MSEGLTPNQKAYLRSLVSSGYLPTIEENAKRLTAPYYWYDPSQPEDNVKGGGTICFVRTDQRLLGITAGHIHKQCVEDLGAYPDCSCQIGGHTFDPVSKLLSLDMELDLAVYALSDIQVSAAGGDVHHAPKWPPEIDDQDMVIAGGWPWHLRREGVNQITHSFLHFGARLDLKSDRNLGVVTYTSSSIPWGSRALPADLNLGGLSGGPVYRLHERGVFQMTLVGVIYEYGPDLEVLYARPLTLVGVDGSLG